MRQRFNLGYFISEGFHSIFTHGLMSFAAVCMIVACLLIMGSFSLVAVNIGNMLGDLERQNEFFAFVDERFSDAQVKALQEKLEAVPNVSAVTLITKEEAKTRFDEQYADSENARLFEDLSDDVYRDRFSIHVTDIEQFSATVRAVEAMEADGIAWVRAESDVAQGFVVVRNVTSGVALILIGMLLVMSLFIISNTIKLGTFTRRDEIAIMKMCGATNGFVRWPFVFEGMILGLTGAILAFFLQWGIYSMICQAIGTGNTIQWIYVLPFQEMAVQVLCIFAGTGFVVGVGGSVLTIRKFLQV